MQYKDKSTAFKVGVLKKCAELHLDADTEDVVFALLEKVAETGVGTVPSDPAAIREAYGEGVGVAPAPPETPAVPETPATPAVPATPSTPTVKSEPNAWDKYTSGWADNPWGMAGKVAPYVLGGGLLGGIAGGGKGALLGAGAGLLGPMARDYVGGLWNKSNDEFDDASLINAISTDPTAVSKFSAAQQARLRILAKQNPAAFASETAQRNMAALSQG